MKQIILITALIMIIASCSNNDKKSDAYGNFEAIETLISSETNGKLINFDIEEGAIIDSGKIVGVIDTIQLHLKKVQLNAQKRALTTKYPNIVGQINIYKEQLKNAHVEKNRFEKLFKDNAATQKQLDDINASISVIEKQIAAVEAQNSTVSAELQTFDSQIEQIEDQISKSILINPFKATVISKYAERFEVTAMGKPLYKIADLSSLELKAYVSGEQVPNIKLGQKVKVLVDKDKKENRTFDGEIVWISSKSEFTPKLIQTKDERVNMVYAIKIKVINDGYLKIGMPGEVLFN